MIPLRDNIPLKIVPIITRATVVICVLVFLWQLGQGKIGFWLLPYSFGVIPAILGGDHSLPPELSRVPPEMTLLTYMFLHGGWMHLIGNMLYLWIFGDNVEEALGHGRFLVFYLLCGIAAALGQAQLQPGSEVPMIGASGAVSGVLGAYALLYPHAQVLIVIPFGFFAKLMHMPAIILLGLWFVFQVLNSLWEGLHVGGIAWFAHIGGFIAGLVLVPFFKRRHVRLFPPSRPNQDDKNQDDRPQAG
ncbi:MAG TPA: rhomboid family intramembrane serine protease [Gammaproteobacteria bacterium]|nr:rhomboid family intramembrane serine protease [Gammaproteobacteria bacterium]